MDFADASVAQLVAQRIRNAWVAGSSPAGSFQNKGFIEIEKVRKHRSLRTFSVVRLSAYVSNRCKSGIRPVVGRI